MTTRLVRAAVLAASGMALALPSVWASAQQTQPRGFENLEVLPRDMPRDTLMQIMRGFTFALGVRCEYCHATTPNPDGGQPRLDAAEIHRQRNERDSAIARYRMVLQKRLNDQRATQRLRELGVEAGARP